MKRAILFLLTAVMLVSSLAACSTTSNSKSSSKTTSVGTVETQTEEEEAEAVDYTALSVSELRSLAADGDFEAAYYAGVCYEYGLEVSQDYALAMEYYLMAAEGGLGKADVAIGYLYFSGCGVDISYEKATSSFAAGVDAGDLNGYVGLARILVADELPDLSELSIDDADASDADADAGDADADVSDADAEDAVAEAEDEDQDAKVDDADGTDSDTTDTEEDSDASKAITYLRKAYEAGLVDGIYFLGYFYENGIGADQDYERALELYNTVASMDKDELATEELYAYHSALTRLGILYLNGWGVEQDRETGTDYIKQAADDGFSMAEYYMGLVYEMGYGVDKDYETAMEWFSLAAAKEYAPALNQIGYMYFNGYGVDADYEQAVYYEKLAAAQGYVAAQVNLGFLYENGYGVEQNLSTALAYYEMAASEGYDGAEEAVARVERLLSTT